MSRDCQFSKETIDACSKHAGRYEVALRGEMAMGAPTDPASRNNRILELEGNIKSLEHLIKKLNNMEQLTHVFLQEEKTSRDTVQCREPKGRSGEQHNNDDDSGLYSAKSETFLSQSTDGYEADDDKSNQKKATTIGGPRNIHPTDDTPNNNLNN